MSAYYNPMRYRVDHKFWICNLALFTETQSLNHVINNHPTMSYNQYFLLLTAFSVSYVPLINPIVVREDGGTIELLRIEKQGQTEIPVDVTFSGGVIKRACVSYYIH